MSRILLSQNARHFALPLMLVVKFFYEKDLRLSIL